MSNLDGLRVDHAGLDQAASDLYEGVKKIDGRLNRLEQELSKLSADWVGEGRGAYGTAKARWDAAMQEMKDLLDDTSKTVYQSNQEYRDADLRAAARF